MQARVEKLYSSLYQTHIIQEFSILALHRTTYIHTHHSIYEHHYGIRISRSHRASSVHRWHIRGYKRCSDYRKRSLPPPRPDPRNPFALYPPSLSSPCYACTNSPNWLYTMYIALPESSSRSQLPLAPTSAQATRHPPKSLSSGGNPSAGCWDLGGRPPRRRR